MQYGTLYDGTTIPALGLGTWRMGGGMTPDYSQDERYIEAIRTALNIGYRHIDTAQMYGSGHTEELVGRAIAGFPREELFITTKVSRTNLRYADVLKACDGSLQRLGVSSIDLYLIHWPNPSIPLEETFRALNELVASGKVKRLGVSNFDLELLKRAQLLADTPIATDQVKYHLLAREPERTGLLDYCRANDILLTAYSPLGKGSVLRRPELRRLARRLGATPAQIAISWLLHKPGVITIPKASSEEHLKENFEAVDLELSEEELALLDDLTA